MHVDEEHHVSHIHTSRDIISAYDLVAVIPHSEAALERCLQHPTVEHIDIVSLPAGHRSSFMLKPSMLQRAIRAGLHFELCYSAALRDGLSRRHLVSNLQVGGCLARCDTTVSCPFRLEHPCLPTLSTFRVSSDSCFQSSDAGAQALSLAAALTT